MQDVSSAKHLQLNGKAESEREVRQAWRVGDRVEIFSKTANRWYVGQVRRIYTDDEGEWLDCQYERVLQRERQQISKDVDRYGVDVRPVRRDDAPQTSPQRPLYSHANSSNMDAATLRRLMTEYENTNNAIEQPNEENKSEPECTLALIKPDRFLAGHALIEKYVLKNGFRVLDVKQARLTKTRAEAFYAKLKGEVFFDDEAKAFYLTEHRNNMPADFSEEQKQAFYKQHMREEYFKKLIAFMTSGPIYALKLQKVDAIKDWLAIMGPADPFMASQENIQYIRARAESVVENSVHGSHSIEAAAREIDFFFDCEQTFALIKPDAVSAGKADEIVARIESDGYTVLERRQTTLSKERAEEFYTQHKGKAFFNKLVTFMSSGEVVALKIEKKNAIKAWLNCPWRRRIGVHGSDSIRTAVRELTYFFPQQETLALIKPDAIRANTTTAIEKRIAAEGFTVLDSRTMQLSEEQAKNLYAEHKECGFFPEVIKHMTSFVSVALKLRATNAVAKLSALMGPADKEQAKKHAPNSIRGKYASSSIKNAVHCPDSVESVKRELAMFFPCVSDKLCSAKQHTLALIKPDAVASGKAQEIMDRIVYEGFVIRDQLQIKLSEERAVEIYDEQKRFNFFGELIAFMTSGEVVALMLEHEDAIQKWRDVMGSVDTEVAKKQSPQSVRALFGTDAIRNAVHGSKSVHLAKREIDFFFTQ